MMEKKKKWKVRFSCCTCSHGEEDFGSWDEADAARNRYEAIEDDHHRRAIVEEI